MRQRLKGPSVASYYPPRIGTISQLRSLYPENEILDDKEEDWLEHLNVARSRGKATPKKKRTAAGRFIRGSRGSNLGADISQNQRSSTRGSRQISARKYSLGDCVYLHVQESIGRRFIWNGKRRIYTGTEDARTHQSSTFARFLVPTFYILLFTPISAFPFTTPHSFSNSSSQGTLTLKCSGCTGTFTL